MSSVSLLPPIAPEIGSYLERGWHWRHLDARARIVAVALNEPERPWWVAIGRVWIPKKRGYRYEVITAVAMFDGVWRRSPRLVRFGEDGRMMTWTIVIVLLIWLLIPGGE
jgi:hypothetical protein